MASAAALTIVCCSKSEPVSPQEENHMVTLRIIADDELDAVPASRTQIDETSKQINWSATNEKLEIIEITGPDFSQATSTAETFQHASTSGFTLNDRKADFTVSLPENSATPLLYTALYPAATYDPANGNPVTNFRLRLPIKQTPGLLSFDPDADLLLAEAVEKSSQPDEPLSFRFKRIAAIGKMTLKGITTGEHISQVTLTSTQPLASYSRANLLTGEISQIGYNNQCTITLDMQNREATGEDVVWFTALPSALGAEDELTVEVVTDGAIYTRTIPIGETAESEFRFTSGAVTAFGVPKLTKTLTTVDFTSGELQSLFPASADQKTDETVFTVGGHDYKVSGQVTDAGKVFYYRYNAERGLYFNRTTTSVDGNACGFIELPAEEGYVLKSIDIVDVQSAKTYRVYAEKKAIYDFSDTNHLGSVANDKTAGKVTLEVTGAAAGTPYYLCCPIFSYVKSITVTYVQP